MAASCESMVRSFFVKILLKIFAIPYIKYCSIRCIIEIFVTDMWKLYMQNKVFKGDV